VNEAPRKFRLRFEQFVATEPHFGGSSEPFEQTNPEIELAPGEQIVAVDHWLTSPSMSMSQVLAMVWIAEEVDA